MFETTHPNTRSTAPNIEIEHLAAETVEEETDIANLLIADDSAHSMDIGIQEQRERSLESDDAQTKENLNPPIPPVAPPPYTGPLKRVSLNPNQALKQLQAGTRSRYSLRSTPLNGPPRSQPERKERGKAHVELASLELHQAFTDRSWSRVRLSSEEPFPPPGTRASEAKKELERREKYSPFKPTPGTRAEKLLRTV